MSVFSNLKTWLHRAGGYYCNKITEREYQTQEFRVHNERAVEYAFLFHHLSRLCPKSVLDVGTGKTALPHLVRTCGPVVTAIDNVKDYWPRGMMNRHYHVLDNDILAPTIQGPFDLVTCISTLEHIRDHDRAVKMMFSLLRPGGRLLLTFPYCENTYIENVYALPGSIGANKYPFPTQVFSRKNVDHWQAENAATLVGQEYWQFFSGSYWTIGDHIVPPMQVSPADLHQLSCLALGKK